MPSSSNADVDVCERTKGQQRFDGNNNDEPDGKVNVSS
jgi:hypothetical protein